MIETSLYTPSPWQARYHALTVDEALGAGAAGPGKTLTLVMDPLEQVMVEHTRCTKKFDHKNATMLHWAHRAGLRRMDAVEAQEVHFANSELAQFWNEDCYHEAGASVGWALHLRRLSKMLDQTVERFKRIYGRIDPHMHWNEQKLTATFSSGYHVQFGHCKDRDDYAQYYSSEFCVAKGTRVLMGDGSFRAIESIRVGEIVETLEGPKRVNRVHRPGAKPCVSARLATEDGQTLATQVHPADHPVLTSAGVRSSRSERSIGAWQPLSEEPRTGPGQPWQTHTWLAHQHRESRELPGYAPPPAQGSDSGAFASEHRVWLPRVTRTSSHAVVHVRGLLLGALGSEREVLVRGWLRAHGASPGPQGYLADCLLFGHSDGVQSPFHTGSDRASLPPRADAVGRTRSGHTQDESAPSPSRSRVNQGTYVHPYTSEERDFESDVVFAACEFEPCGDVEVYDLNVQDCNHYITDTGMVNKNTHVAFDELVQFLESQYDQITSRVRASDWILRRMLKIRSMSNPMVKRESNEDFVVDNPYWVRDLFVEPAPEGNTILKKKIRMEDGELRWKTRIYLPAKLSDNPDPEFRKDYEQRLRGMKHHMRAALLDGNWYFSADGFYAEDWNPNIHICEPFAIPEDWRVFRSMDWGYKKPGCVHWGALDPEGTLYIFREMTFKGKTATEVAKRLLELEEDEGLTKNGRSTVMGPADTQLWEARGSEAMSMAEEFSRQGVNWVPADKKSRRRNAQLLLGRLKDHDDGRSAPGIVFFRTCKNALRTIPSIPTDPGDTECPMDGGDDHWHDSILYLCAHVSKRDKWKRAEHDDDFPDDPEEHGNGGYDGYGGVV